MAKLLTASEAAKRLGVSRRTLYAYVSRGLVRSYGTELRASGAISPTRSTGSQRSVAAGAVRKRLLKQLSTGAHPSSNWRSQRSTAAASSTGERTRWHWRRPQAWRRPPRCCGKRPSPWPFPTTLPPSRRRPWSEPPTTSLPTSRRRPTTRRPRSGDQRKRWL